MALIKKYWYVFLILVIAVGYLGYRGRHRIKAFLGMSSTPAPEVTSQTNYANPIASPSSPTSNNIYMTKTDPVKGIFLTDFNGMSLYTSDKDTTGVSNCTGSCATLWPPYTSGATAQGTFPDGITVITRADGTQQFAWKGMPLYYYSKDTAAGDTSGDGFNNGQWHLAKP